MNQQILHSPFIFQYSLCGWKKVRLKYIARFAYGDPLTAERREEGDIPVYGSNGIVGYHTVANMLAPCIVVGRKGSFGKITYSEKAAFAIDTTYFIDSRYSKNFLRWLYYALQTLGLDEVSQDTGVPGLAREKAYEYYLQLPPHNVQQEIASFLDRKTAAIDTLIAKKQRLIELLEEKRTALINQAVTKGLNPNTPMKDSGIFWIGEIPQHWEIKKLKFLTLKIGSGITPTGGASVYQSRGIPFLRSQNIHSDGLRMNNIAFISEQIHEQMSSSKVCPNDVLLNITGASIGRCSVVPKSLSEANVNQHVCIIRSNQKILPEVLHNYLVSEKGQYQIFMSENGVSREGLNFEQIKSFYVVKPSRSEQQEIALWLDYKTTEIDSLIAKTYVSIEKLQEYRRSLITAAVTGKIDVAQEKTL